VPDSVKHLLLTAAILTCAHSQAHAQKPGEAPDVAFTGRVLKPPRAPLEDLTQLQLPDGFKVSVFAKDLINPRMIAVARDGTVYVTRRSVGDVMMLKDTDGDGTADTKKVVANRPDMHGIAVDGDTAFLATVKDVYRARIKSDGTFGDLERIIDDLPDAGQHPNRTLGVGPDGMLYISVGSTCNACAESSPESAALLRATPDGKKRTIFASGLRNTIGFVWHPARGALVGFDHNIDWHGDDQPAEEVNVLKEGKFYGWPYVLADGFLNPQDEPPGDITLEQVAAVTEKPVLGYTAHAAPMQMTIYAGPMFPKAFQGDAFVAMRGSWNRKPPSGYEVVRIRFADGQPTAIEPFLTGFLKKDGDGYTQFGRLAGLAVARDGALLVGDDENGVIYRVAYDGDAERGSEAPVGIANTPQSPEPSELASQAFETGKLAKLEVTSSAFENGGSIPLRYSDYGESISPPLAWSKGPEGTAAYAVIVDDPDAKPNLVNHWTIFNIPVGTTALPEGIPGAMSLALPENAGQGRTTRGSIGYFGPRPPPTDGPHRYHFQVFALDARLKLKPSADRATLLEAMKGHVLASGTLVGTFDRSSDVQRTVEAAKGLRQR
jgi:Raf kinase inhibitor-like YbhB/YbcL family protein